MFVQMDKITFKSLPIFYEKEKSGIKNNTVRHLSNTEALKVREAERLFLHSDLFIKIKNTETGESFCRILRDISTNDDVTVFTWDEREVPVCCVCGNPIYPLVRADLKKAGIDGSYLYCPGCRED